MPRKTFLRPGKHRGDRERYRQNCSLLGNFSYHAVVKRKQASQFRDFFFLSTAKFHHQPCIPFLCTIYEESIFGSFILFLGFPGGSEVKASACNVGDLGLIPGSGRSPGREDPLEKEMATHSSVLAWRIPGTGEPGRLPSMGSHRVGHD